MTPPTRAALLLAGIGLVVGLVFAGCAQQARHDAAVRAWQDSVAAAEEDAARARSESLHEQRLRERLEQKRAADSAEWARERQGLVARLRTPAVVLADVAVPDTCGPVVTALVEQIAIRDSVLAVDSLHYRAMWDSWDRAHASLGRELVAARVQWAQWEHLAKTAPVRAPKRLVLTADVLKGLGPDDEARAGARVRVSGPVWVAGEYVAADGMAPGWRVGVHLELGVL